MNKVSIIVDNLSVHLQGTTVLDAISFQILPGQHLAITGASGSGKTTLLKALAGLLFHRGTVGVQAAEVAQPVLYYVAPQNAFKSLSNQSSFYYQQRYNSADAADALTLEEEVLRFAGALYTEAAAAGAVEEGLAFFGLTGRRKAPLLQLSNGEHKRLQLLKAVLRQPDVLLLDQPFTGLDAAARAGLHGIIGRLAQQTTIILVTSATEVPEAITHQAVLENGRLQQFAARGQFKAPSRKPALFSAEAPLPRNGPAASFATAVKLVNTTVQYNGKTVLSNINWEVAAGERWLVKGANGAGKSTLLSLITADNPQAYANEIYLFDRRRGTGESIWDIKRNIGFVSPELHWHFDKSSTVAQVVASGFFDTMGLYQRLNPMQESSLQQWLAFFGFSARQNKPLAQLPTGQQRFVLLARALVKHPPLLVLDEPCQGLDDEQAAGFCQLLDALCRETRQTLIYVSHYDEEVPACVERQLLLVNGRAGESVFEQKKWEAA